MPTARGQAAAAVTPGGLIYVMGGGSSYSGSNISPILNTVDIYNTSTKTWTTGPVMPLATRGASAVHHNNAIYVFGGFNTGQINTGQKLDLSNNTWSTFTMTGPGGWELSSAVVNNSIVVISGEDRDSAVAEFLPGDNVFNALANTLDPAKTAQAVAVGSLIYLVGGATSTTTGRLDSFNIATNTWSSSPTDLSTPLVQHAASADSRFIYVAGGSSSNTNGSSPIFDTFNIYDTVTDTWKPGPALPFGIRESVSVVFDNRVYLLGGFGNGNALNTVYAYAIPEPSTYALMLTGGALILIFSLRRRRG